jgi:hypothetical protein
MLQNIKKKLKLYNFNKIYWCFLKNKKVLVLSTSGSLEKYVVFPMYVTLFKQSNNYVLSYKNTNNFYFFFAKWLEQFYKPLQKKLFFKGLGFKFKYSSFKKDKLELKLGFSHMITILIPKKEIKIFLIKKNRLAIEGFNYSLVGNFAQKIRMLKFPDSYNGKGFWYKNEVKTLKEIKKA